MEFLFYVQIITELIIDRKLLLASQLPQLFDALRNVNVSLHPFLLVFWITSFLRIITDTH